MIKAITPYWQIFFITIFTQNILGLKIFLVISSLFLQSGHTWVVNIISSISVSSYSRIPYEPILNIATIVYYFQFLFCPGPIPVDLSHLGCPVLLFSFFISFVYEDGFIFPCCWHCWVLFLFKEIQILNTTQYHYVYQQTLCNHRILIVIGK